VPDSQKKNITQGESQKFPPAIDEGQKILGKGLEVPFEGDKFGRLFALGEKSL